MRSSSERIDIVEFRRKHIQHGQVEFRRTILLRESAPGEIVARGSACISSRIHLVCVLDVVGVGVGLFCCFDPSF
jgi:hypothetical protein